MNAGTDSIGEDSSSKRQATLKNDKDKAKVKRIERKNFIGLIFNSSIRLALVAGRQIFPDEGRAFAPVKEVGVRTVGRHAVWASDINILDANHRNGSAALVTLFRLTPGNRKGNICAAGSRNVFTATGNLRSHLFATARDRRKGFFAAGQRFRIGTQCRS